MVHAFCPLDICTKSSSSQATPPIESRVKFAGANATLCSGSRADLLGGGLTWAEAAGPCPSNQSAHTLSKNVSLFFIYICDSAELITFELLYSASFRVE